MGEYLNHRYTILGNSMIANGKPSFISVAKSPMANYFKPRLQTRFNVKCSSNHSIAKFKTAIIQTVNIQCQQN